MALNYEKNKFKSLKLDTIDQLQGEELKTLLGGGYGSGGGKCNKKSCSVNSDCGSGVCANYGPPCDAWGDCGCRKYC